MSRRALLAIAWALTLIAVGMAAVAVVVAVLNGRAGETAASEPFPIATGLATLLFPLTGLTVLHRQPRNPIAWMFVAAGVLVLAEPVAIPLVTYTHVVLDSDPGWSEVLALIADALWIPSIAIGTVLLFILFPDGRLPSPRWRVLLWVAGAAAALWIPATLFIDEPLYALDSVANPWGVDGSSAVLGPLQALASSVVMLSMLVSIGALVQRWRRSETIERQQLKFLAVPPMALVAATAVAIVLEPSPLAGLLPDLVHATIPVAVGLAILRRGLWGIDRLVSRTLTYGIVSATLVAVYAMVVLIPTAVLDTSGRSDLVVAAGTLAAAALFRPVRDRVQAGLDRRFDRSRYDAKQVVARFGVRLRDEVDLDVLAKDLRATVSEAVAPTSASLLLVPGRSS